MLKTILLALMLALNASWANAGLFDDIRNEAKRRIDEYTQVYIRDYEVPELSQKVSRRLSGLHGHSGPGNVQVFCERGYRVTRARLHSCYAALLFLDRITDGSTTPEIVPWFVRWVKIDDVARTHVSGDTLIISTRQTPAQVQSYFESMVRYHHASRDVLRRMSGVQRIECDFNAVRRRLVANRSPGNEAELCRRGVLAVEAAWPQVAREISVSSRLQIAAITLSDSEGGLDLDVKESLPTTSLRLNVFALRQSIANVSLALGLWQTLLSRFPSPISCSNRIDYVACVQALNHLEEMRNRYFGSEQISWFPAIRVDRTAPVGVPDGTIDRDRPQAGRRRSPVVITPAHSADYIMQRAGLNLARTSAEERHIQVQCMDRDGMSTDSPACAAAARRMAIGAFPGFGYPIDQHYTRLVVILEEGRTSPEVSVRESDLVVTARVPLSMTGLELRTAVLGELIAPSLSLVPQIVSEIERVQSEFAAFWDPRNPIQEVYLPLKQTDEDREFARLLQQGRNHYQAAGNVELPQGYFSMLERRYTGRSRHLDDSDLQTLHWTHAAEVLRIKPVERATLLTCGPNRISAIRLARAYQNSSISVALDFSDTDHNRNMETGLALKANLAELRNIVAGPYQSREAYFRHMLTPVFPPGRYELHLRMEENDFSEARVDADGKISGVVRISVARGAPSDRNVLGEVRSKLWNWYQQQQDWVPAAHDTLRQYSVFANALKEALRSQGVYSPGHLSLLPLPMPNERNVQTYRQEYQRLAALVETLIETRSSESIIQENYYYTLRSILEDFDNMISLRNDAFEALCASD